MSRYVVTPNARDDLEDITLYLLAAGGPQLARHVIGRLHRGMRLIGEMPGIGHLRQDLTDEPVKFWQVFSYLIVYDPIPRPVPIVAVVHSARDVAAVLAKRGTSGQT